MIDGQQRWYASEISLTNQVVVDVGANRGALSQFFWSQGKGSNRVISVEPLPQNHKLIQKKITKSKAKDWHLEACALSDRTGEMTLARSHSRDHGWNSVRIDLTQQPAELEQQLELDEVIVPCKTLVQVAPEATVVKMDIEGGEYAVLDQALADFGKVHTWAVELHMIPDRPLADVLGQFSDQGFNLIAAGRSADRADPAWISIPINPRMQWDRVPVAKQTADGRAFKMLHIIARR